MNIPLQVSKFSSSASKKDEDQTPIEDASSTKASAANTVDDNANDDDKKDSVETKGSEDEKIEETEDLSAKYKEQAAQYMNDIKNIDPKKLMNRAYTKILDLIDYGKEEMAEAYKELMDEDKKTALKRKVVGGGVSIKKKSSDDDDEESNEEKYEGPTALVHVKEELTGWEAMKQRLGESELIKNILRGTKKFQKTDIGKGATDIGHGVKDKIDDVREYWETTQNPVVYYVSGAIDGLTGDTEEGLAIGHIRKYDPDFEKETWASEMENGLCLDLVTAHLDGNIDHLKEYLGEAVLNKLNEDIKARKKDNKYIDPNVLDFREVDVKIKDMEGLGPVVALTYQVQQINVVRNKEGKIVEGDENDIRARFYVVAFKLEIEEGEEGEGDMVALWKCIDYGYMGNEPWY